MVESEIKLRPHHAALVRKAHIFGLSPQDWANKLLKDEDYDESVAKKVAEIFASIIENPDMQIRILPHGDVENDPFCNNCAKYPVCSKNGIERFSQVSWDMLFGRLVWGIKANTVITTKELLQSKS